MNFIQPIIPRGNNYHRCIDVQNYIKRCSVSEIGEREILRLRVREEPRVSSPTTMRNCILSRAVHAVQYEGDVKDPAVCTPCTRIYTPIVCGETLIPAGWLAMCCVRRWSAGIEKGGRGGAGEGQVRAAPRSIVLSRGGAPGPVATRRDAPRQLHLSREPVSMGMHPLPGAGHPPPREVRKPRGRNGGAPFSPRSPTGDRVASALRV